MSDTARRIWILISESLMDPDGEAVEKMTNTIGSEIDGLAAQLAEAVAMHRFCDLQLNTVNADLQECRSALRLALAGTDQHYFAIPARIDDVRAALAKAQAEIARLTPAAEAYSACVRWENASSYGTQEECASAWTEYLSATNRARTAKVVPNA